MIVHLLSVIINIYRFLSKKYKKRSNRNVYNTYKNFTKKDCRN